MQQNIEALIVANWKMNPQTVEDSEKLFGALKKTVGTTTRLQGKTVVIAPPFPFLPGILKLNAKGPLLLGAQDVSAEKMGPHTGDVALSMLKSLGVSHVIIGHSERRAKGESDAEIEKKVALSLKDGVTAILCVGERERDSHGKYFGVVENQVRSALKNVPNTKLTRLVVAYEPVWAISTSSAHPQVATPDDAHEMILFIRKILTDLYGRKGAGEVRIIYGGSVDQKNASALAEKSGAQGFLVGGASLRPEDFSAIIKSFR